MVLSPGSSSSGSPARSADSFEEGHDQGGPAGLMACADAAARLPVEMFVEKDEVAPMRIGGVPRVTAVAGAAGLAVGEKEGRQAPGNLARHFFQVHHATRAGRAFDLHGVPVEMMVPL